MTMCDLLAGPKSMVMYIAEAAWLLRSFNILVCYFMMRLQRCGQLKKTNYISERRLTLMISRINSEW